MNAPIISQNMTAAEVLESSHKAQAIIAVCRAAADGVERNLGQAANIAAAIETSLGVALDLFSIINDAFEQQSRRVQS